MADASCQSSQVIIKDYLLESIKVASDNNSDVHDAYIFLAKFSDREYQHVKKYQIFKNNVLKFCFDLGVGLYKINRFSKDNTKCGKIQAES